MTKAAALPAGVVADAVAATRALLRLDEGVEAALLTRLAATALTLAEAFTGTAVVARPFEDVVAAGAGWRLLANAPVTAIAGVAGLSVEGAPVVLPVGAYAIDIDADGRGWVRVDGASGRAAVGYTAGLAADWAGMPAPMAQSVAMLAAHLFDHREDDVAPPAAVAALWRPYRRMRLDTGAHA